MAESTTKKAAAKKLADPDASKTTKKVAAKTLASDKPNQALAEAAVQQTAAKARDLSDAAVETSKNITLAPAAIAQLTDETLNHIADGADVAADQLHQVAKVSRRLRGRDISVGLIGFTLGAAVGGYVGFRVAEKKLRLRFDDLLAEETEKVREHYNAKIVAADSDTAKPDLDVLADKLEMLRQQKEGQKMVENLGYIPPGPSATITDGKTPADLMRDEDPDQEEKRSMVAEIEARPSRLATGPETPREQFTREATNLFAGNTSVPEWDYAEETKNRRPDLPYVIHVDEHVENSPEHEQVELTFFEEDEVLCDVNDNPVLDADEAIGLANLDRFGHGSADGNTVYIRNEVREVDFEIQRTHLSYAQHVHGFDTDSDGGSLQHSDRSWKGRQDYDSD